MASIKIREDRFLPFIKAGNKITESYLYQERLQKWRRMVSGDIVVPQASDTQINRVVPDMNLAPNAIDPRMVIAQMLDVMSEMHKPKM